MYPKDFKHLFHSNKNLKIGFLFFSRINHFTNDILWLFKVNHDKN